jgi:pilus assembly protein CpaB
MSKRTVGLSVALLLAALATLILVSYVSGLEDRAYSGVETVSVFVAKETIPAGTTGDSAISKGLIAKESVPRKVRAESAVGSLEELRGKVAAVTILKGEQIVSARFVLPGQAKGVLPIPVDRQAMSVEVGIPSGVAGFVQPGDRISVIAQLELPKTGLRTGQANEPRVQYLLQAVEVLAVGPRVVVFGGEGSGDKGAQQTQQQQNRVLLTLALTPAQAEKLAFALFQGEVYFTLLPEGQKPVTTPGRTIQNAFA